MSKKVVKIKRSTSLLGRELPGQGLVAAGLLLTPLAHSMSKSGQGTFDPSLFNPSAAEGASDAFAQQLDNLLLGGSQGLELTEVDDLAFQQAVPFDESLLEALAQGELPSADLAIQSIDAAIDADLAAKAIQPSDIASAGAEAAASGAAAGETWVLAQAETASGAGAGGAAGTSATAAGAATGVGAAAGATVGAAAVSPALAAGLLFGAGVFASTVLNDDEDTTPPVAPSVSLANDTGSSGSDFVTRDGSLKVDGLEPGAKVEYSFDGGKTWSETPNPVEGENTVLVRQTDAAGNVGQLSEPFTFRLDTEVTGVTAKLAAASDTLPLGDNKTSEKTPTFEGTAEAGSAIKLTLGDREFTTTSDANGQWKVVVPADKPLASGSYQPVLQVTDLAGNVVTSSGGLDGLEIQLTKTIFVVDGPLKGAKVYYDRNGDGIATAKFGADGKELKYDEDSEAEWLGETDGNGGISVNYVPVAGAKFIIVPDEDTVDVFTGNKFDTPLQLEESGLDGTEIVSPLTTLVASGVDEAALKLSLGIPNDVQLSKFNFVEVLKQGSSDPAIQAAASKVAAATVVAGNIIESTIKAAQAQAGAVSSGADLQALTSQIGATVGKVLAALPPGTDLQVATEIASKVTMASTLDKSVSADALISQVTSVVAQAASSGGNIEAALQQASAQVSTSIASTTTSTTLAKLVDSTATSLGSVSAQVETLFVSVASGDKALEEVTGLGGDFDKLEDAAEEQVNDAVNEAAGLVLKKGGLFDRDGDGFEQGADVDFLEDDEYFVEGTASTVKGNVFVDAQGVPSTGVHTVGIGSLQSLVPDYVKGSASDPNVVGSTYTISTSDFGSATIDASTLLSQMGFAGAPPLTGSWTGGAYAFKATAGSAIVKTITVEAGQTLTFSYKFGSFDYLPWNDYGFLALKLQGGSSADDGVRELVDIRDLKGPQLYKDAGVWKVNSSGEYSFTFTTGGTYTLGIGATDVGDKIFDTILTVQNLRVGGVLLDSSLDSKLGNVDVDAVAPIIDVSAYVQTGNFGTLVITKTGDYYYQPGGDTADDVPPGTLLEDTFTYTVKMDNGFLASQKLVFTVMGEPDGQISSLTDTGEVGDSITFDDSPVLTGTAAFGSKVTVTVAGKTYDTITVGSTGVWSVQLDELGDGEYTPSITIVNKGATATADGTTFTIDTTPPQLLSAGTSADGSQVVLSYGGALSPNSAPASAFNVTVDGFTVTVSNVAVAGNKVTLTLASPVAVGQAVAVSYADPSSGDDAAAVQDVAGNDAASLVAQAVVNNAQDTTPPEAPVVISLFDDVGSIIGVLPSGSLTDDAKPVFKITAESGSTVNVFQGTTLLGQAIEFESGSFVFAPQQPFAEGGVALTAVAIDKAGNASPASAPFTFTVDLTAPGVPQLALADDTGASKTDLITNNGALKIVSGKEEGATVEYSSDGGATWTSTFSAKDGSNSVLVRQTDSAGNVSTAVTPFVFTLDTSAAMPVITSVVDNSGSTADRITSDTTPVLTVTAEPGSTIVLGSGGVALPPADYSVVESTPGTFTVTVNKPLSDGGYGLVAIDKAGNQSLLPFPGATSGFLIDTKSPGQASITQLTDDTGSSQTDRVTSDNTPVLKVTAEPGAKLVVGSGGVETTAAYTVVEDSPGQYTITFTGAIPDGTYGVRVIDVAGNKDDFTDIGGRFTIDTQAPAKPPANIATIIQGGGETSISGRVQLAPGDALTVTVGGAFTSQVGQNGFWRVDDPAFALDFAGSLYPTTVTATDLAGNFASTDLSLNGPLAYGQSLINATQTMGSGQAMASLPTDFRFDVGDDVLVIGTNFLASSQGPQLAGAAAIFGDADVTTRLSGGDITRFSAGSFSDADFDNVIDRLESAGVDRVQVLSADLQTLIGREQDLSFDAGTDVQVVGTGFLGSGSGLTLTAFHAMLGDADTTVSMTNGDIATILANGDAYLDDLTARLELAGIDRLVMSGDQARQLADAGEFSFDAGTDITVYGTAFLASGNPAALSAAHSLFGEADLSAQLTQADSDRLLGMGTQGDGAFDGLVDRLSQAGADTIQLDAGQVEDFAVADFTFQTGVDVTVSGTAFLGGGDMDAIEAASSLFAGNKVTVVLAESDVRRVLDGDREFTDLVNDLRDAGVQRILIDSAQALALADKGLAFPAGTEVVIRGDAFPEDSGDLAKLASLLVAGSSESVKAAVVLSNAIISDVVAETAQFDSESDAETPQEGADQFISSLKEAGVDHLLLGPDQLLALTAAGLDLTDEIVRLSEQYVSLEDFQVAGFKSDKSADNTADLDEVIRGMDALLSVSNDQGFLVVSDDLANALAEAGIDTSTVEGVSVDVVASADPQTPDGGLAFLASSAQDMVQAGVDKVVLTSGTDVAFALRDADESAPDLGFTLDDLPAFDKTANPDGDIGLVVDQDDLAALVNSLGLGATEADAVNALAEKGFTDVGLVGVQLGQDALNAAATSGVEFVDASTLATELQISEQDLVKLLGGGSDSTDPFDPFHKP